MKNLLKYSISALIEMQLEAAQERDFVFFNELEIEINRRCKDDFFKDFLNELL